MRGQIASALARANQIFRVRSARANENALTGGCVSARANEKALTGGRVSARANEKALNKNVLDPERRTDSTLV